MSFQDLLEAANPLNSSREPTPDLIPPTSSLSEDWKRYMPPTPPSTGRNFNPVKVGA
jgi:hypothetical protein